MTCDGDKQIETVGGGYFRAKEYIFYNGSGPF